MAVSMQRISSNSTLFLKFFVPTFWIVFFGAVTIAILFYRLEYVGNIPAIYVKLFMGFSYLVGILVMYFTLLKLKRIEMDEAFMYVSNYFKNYRYPYHNIEKIELSSFLFLSIGTVSLRVRGSFGKKMIFVADRQRFKYALKKFPDVRGEVRINGLKIVED